MKKEHVYMIYAPDGLPEFQADNLKEVADYFKTSVASVMSMISRKEKINGRRVMKVII